MTDATPQQFAAVFSLSNDGQAVFDSLARRFAGPPFVAGQSDVTAYNCGTKAVIEHIAAMLEQAEPAPRRINPRSSDE